MCKCLSGKLYNEKYIRSFFARNDRRSIFHKGICWAFILHMLYFYALGQLVNGFIGDRVHPKYMLITGFCRSDNYKFAILIYALARGVFIVGFNILT